MNENLEDFERELKKLDKLKQQIAENFKWVPEEYKYIAADKYGFWYAFTSRPMRLPYGWDWKDHNQYISLSPRTEPFPGGWMDSLIRRKDFKNT